MTDLVRLDGPATAAIADELVAVYRAAMSAPPFFETEVETGWFAEELAGDVTEPGFRCWTARDGDRLVGFAYGFPTPEIPSDGWYGLVRAAVGDTAAERLEGQFPSSASPSTPSGGGEAWAASSSSTCSPAPTRSGHGSSPTTSTPRPAPSTAPWASTSSATAPSAGTTPTASSWAPNSKRAAPTRQHRAEPDPPAMGPQPGG